MNELPELDPLIHAPARLRIMSTLSALDDGDTISFSRLQDLLSMTSGNLITHLRKLEDARYVRTSAQRSEAAKTTALELTDEGRRSFRHYRDALQLWLQDPGGGSPLEAGAATPDLPGSGRR